MALPIVSSDQDYANIPVGSQYQTADGMVMTKNGPPAVTPSSAPAQMAPNSPPLQHETPSFISPDTATAPLENGPDQSTMRKPTDNGVGAWMAQHGQLGHALHGLMEPARAIAQGVDALSGNNESRRVWEQYQQDYNLNRGDPGNIDATGHNSSPDPTSDMASGLITLAVSPEAKGATQAAELWNAIKAGGLAGALTPREDNLKDGTAGFAVDKLKQIGEGGLLGVLGHVLGTVVSPNVNAQTKLLLDKGINPTFGQLARQSDNPIMGSLGQAESLSSGLPWIGPQIRNAQSRGVLDLNKAYGQEALTRAGLGELPKDLENGQEISKYVKEQFNKKYPSLYNQMSFTNADPTFQTIDQALMASSPILGKGNQDLYNEIRQNLFTSKLNGQGQLSGNQLEASLSDLRKEYEGYKGADNFNDRKLGNHLEMLYDAIKGQAMKNAPPDLAADLANTDEGYRLYSMYTRKGSEKAVNTQGTATPAQFGTGMKQSDKSAFKGRTSEGEMPLQDMVNASNSVLTRLPDSETANREATGRIWHQLGNGLMFSAGAGSAGYGAMHGYGPEEVVGLLGLAGLSSIASRGFYGPRVQSFMKDLMTGRQSQPWKDAAYVFRQGVPSLETGAAEKDTSTPSTDQQTQQILNNGVPQ